MSSVYHRKLFALLHDPLLKALYKYKDGKGPWEQVTCLYQNQEALVAWWERHGGVESDHLGAASDRVTILRHIYADAEPFQGGTRIEIRHPISGQSSHTLLLERCTPQRLAKIESNVISREFLRRIDDDASLSPDQKAEKVFWWFWRFYPEAVAKELGEPGVLTLPADTRIPDCPTHSHNATVSALAGAMFPTDWQAGAEPERPYLVMFTFSPVQEFIKSSRKFVDFWAGSYLLHYLSVQLCWLIAETYGPDAVITPSLWGHDIIDALLVQKYPEFAAEFAALGLDNPADQFTDRTSTSLSTAGFPNVITALVPGKDAADALGETLAGHLKSLWKTMGTQVKETIKAQVMQAMQDPAQRSQIWQAIQAALPADVQEEYEREMAGWQQGGQWAWNHLWDAQLDHTWETYWVALPLGDPEQPLSIHQNFGPWVAGQETLAQSRPEPLPTQVEAKVYNRLNVGTWWGSLQARLGQCAQAIKNTRTWEIPIAPGERSTISGLYSAVHPSFLYRITKTRNGDKDFREGGGRPAGSMRLFWLVMSQVFKGLFNGSEHLNALELTKRMAWRYGGVAESLGISLEGEDEYENLIRFPNLSSIAAARVATENPRLVRDYWQLLNQGIRNDAQLRQYRDQFESKTRRPFQVRQADQALNPEGDDGRNYNGVMFSSKWLADDLGLQKPDELAALRQLIDQTHQQVGCKDGSPADWWCLVLADGDGMGRYVTGRMLKPYKHYLATGVEKDLLERAKKISSASEESWRQLLSDVKKRMGPATHIGLNRALLDFSNRLVPYLTEKRFCGKVIYSGGDDVMAALPLEDLPEYLLSLRAAWCGGSDPKDEFTSSGGYWIPKHDLDGLPQRPYFTMGEGATMSVGIVIAHKSVPLPTVLENIWEAEKERAKKLPKGWWPKVPKDKEETLEEKAEREIPAKDGLCFRVIYGSGNTLEAVMKGHLLSKWWSFIEDGPKQDFGPVMYRLAEELPRRCMIMPVGQQNDSMLIQATRAILHRRDSREDWQQTIEPNLMDWLRDWETWASSVPATGSNLGCSPEDLGQLLRFSAFWIDKKRQRDQWINPESVCPVMGTGG